ncbi:MAG: LysR substrate-binding domain-containing protein [Mesorhizobium sp.]|jgi:DNA-binding transcriptional LysR family regulator
MQSLRHLLPSAGSLIVFEAAGRLSSFTAAGRELGMTQAAVSYAVRGLEDQLGVKLFQRRHRQVRLTEAGTRFFADVTLGLSHIRKSAEELRALAGGMHVTLSASTAFASFWMMPRLQKFRDDLPGIDLRIQTADRDLDLIAEGIPLGIRGGSAEDWPDYDLLPIAQEEILAVAGPAYVAREGEPRTPAEMTNHRLIHLEEPFRPAANWNEWFHSAGISGAAVPRGLLINDYVLVIQAVMEGQGIALGWRHLTDRLIASGLLVRLTGHAMSTGKGFHVAWPKNRPLSESAEKVRDWLAAQA